MVDKPKTWMKKSKKKKQQKPKPNRYFNIHMSLKELHRISRHIETYYATTKYNKTLTDCL